MENIKKQLIRDWNIIKGLKGGARWEYIWDYYKIPICSVLFLIFVVCSVISGNLKKQNYSMYAILVNANTETVSTCMDDILSEAGYDMTESCVAVENNYSLRLGEGAESDTTTLQVLAAQFLIGDLDLFVADQPVFDMYTKQGGYENIGILLPEEMKQKYADDLYSYELEDGTIMIGGVWLRKGSALHEAGYYQDDVLAGIASQAQNLEEALEVLKGLLASNP